MSMSLGRKSRNQTFEPSIERKEPTAWLPRPVTAIILVEDRCKYYCSESDKGTYSISAKAPSGTKSGVIPKKSESTVYCMLSNRGRRALVTIAHQFPCVLRARVSWKLLISLKLSSLTCSIEGSSSWLRKSASVTVAGIPFMRQNLGLGLGLHTCSASVCGFLNRTFSVTGTRIDRIKAATIHRDKASNGAATYVVSK